MKRTAIAAVLLSAFIYAGAATAEDLPKAQESAPSNSIMSAVKEFMGLNAKETTLEAAATDASAHEVLPMALTNNLDYNFVANLIPFQETTIESAKFVLANSQNAVVKDLAEQLASRGQSELEAVKALSLELQNTKSEWSPEVVESFNATAKTILTQTHEAMMAVKTGNVDKDFVTGLILHHEGIVKLSDEILKLTKNDKVTTLANNLKLTQANEIKILQDLLAKL